MSTSDLLLTRMRAQADAWETSGDKRYIFLRCYSMMTANMLTALEQGRFSDSRWVERLLQRFAEYYFDALGLYEQQHPFTPAVWRQVHDASRHQRLHVLQHLLLGVNAHINFDLALALCDGLRLEWPVMTAEIRQSREADHNLVNQIISETIDAVQDTVVEKASPAMALVDKLMGRVDEWLLSQLIASWRTEVWREACAMLECNNPEERDKMRQELEQKVMGRAVQLLGV